MQVGPEAALQLSYEDQCRQHLETCLEASAGYHEDLAVRMHMCVHAYEE